MARLVHILLLFLTMNTQAGEWTWGDNEYWVQHAILYLENNPIIHVDQNEKTCLAHNIYFEARNESYEGKLAVATVTTNRVHSPKYPDTYCEVVWEVRINPRTGRKVPQFSWTLDGKSDRPAELKEYEEAKEIAEEVLRYGKRSDIISEDVLNYHAHYVEPHWAARMSMVAQIDTHLFYSH